MMPTACMRIVNCDFIFRPSSQPNENIIEIVEKSSSAAGATAAAQSSFVSLWTAAEKRLGRETSHLFLSICCIYVNIYPNIGIMSV